MALAEQLSTAAAWPRRTGHRHRCDAAACSAAALDWLLGAYAVRLGSIDHAIALIGPNTGISPSLGLLDATGRPLARAVAASGVSPRNGQVHSIAELEAWLNRGPLALDGAR